MAPLTQVIIMALVCGIIVFCCACLYDKYKYRCYYCKHFFRKCDVIVLKENKNEKNKFLCKKCYGLDN